MVTESRQSNSFIVWALGAEPEWSSCVLGVFTDRQVAIDYALNAADQRSNDPGDTIVVQGFVLDDADYLPEEVWRSK